MYIDVRLERHKLKREFGIDVGLLLVLDNR